MQGSSGLIFLDFDGVLNSKAHARHLGVFVRGVADLPLIYRFDRRAVRLLNELISLTGARVVISSWWRRRYTTRQIEEALKQCGFVGEIVGSTPVLNAPRGREIQIYLLASRHRGRYVIFDDNHIEGHKPHFIQTTKELGLQPEHIQRAAYLL